MLCGSPRSTAPRRPAAASDEPVPLLVAGHHGSPESVLADLIVDEIGLAPPRAGAARRGIHSGRCANRIDAVTTRLGNQHEDD